MAVMFTEEMQSS